MVSISLTFLLLSSALSVFHSLLDYYHQLINMPLCLPLKLSWPHLSLTIDPFLCSCLQQTSSKDYLFSFKSLSSLSLLNPLRSTFYKHLSTKTALVMIPSDLHILYPPINSQSSLHLPYLQHLTTLSTSQDRTLSLHVESPGSTSSVLFSRKLTHLLIWPGPWFQILLWAQWLPNLSLQSRFSLDL